MAQVPYPQVIRSGSSLRVMLSSGVQLDFAVEQQVLFGLQQATVNGMPCSDEQRICLPVIADEDQGWVAAWLHLEAVSACDGGQDVHCTLLASRDQRAWRHLFVHNQDGLHRDVYRFAMTSLPATACKLQAWQALHHSLAGELFRVGHLTWHLRPAAESIDGWQWQGWRSSFSVQLDQGYAFSCLRQLGCWSLGGRAVGNTLVAVRYRGLGRIEQPLTNDGSGGVTEAWSTTEILPGAVGEAPAISPALPRSQQPGDRADALAHRSGAWIGRLPRGAGAPFVDFHYQDGAALAILPERQGNLRALSEIMPGDDTISYTDEEWCTHGRHLRSVPLCYLALRSPQPWARNEWRSRWHEVDQWARDRVAAELDFIQPTALPGIGLLYWGQHPQWYQELLDNHAVTAWQQQGVRMIASHSPGWLSNASSDQALAAAGITQRIPARGECSILDFRPDSDMLPLWQRFATQCQRQGVRYLPWLGMTIVEGGPLHQRVGADPAHWSRNRPHDQYGPAYYFPHSPKDRHLKGNVHHPAFRQTYLDALAQTRQRAGYDGFWIDSFHNLFMSQLAWADGSGAPMQRAWWEQCATWSRDGLTIMAESHAFPGLSCSIEVADWQEDILFLRHVWKWYRSDEEEQWSPERLDELCFRAAAVKGWTASNRFRSTQGEITSIPSFSRIAHDYLAALPDMGHPSILANDAGVLWRKKKDPTRGVWFCFHHCSIPNDVQAWDIQDALPRGQGLRNTTALQVLGLKADDDLRRAFGLSVPAQQHAETP